MNLRNNLYIIKNREESGYRIKFLKDSIIYKSHFPEMPVTPGVCIIQIASELLEDKLGNSIELYNVTNAKFLNVINPDLIDEVSYKFNKITEEENNLIKVSAEVSSSNKIFAKLSLAYHLNS